MKRKLYLLVPLAALIMALGACLSGAATPTTAPVETTSPATPTEPAAEAAPQFVTITSPQDGAELTAASFEVSGEGGALFEGTVVVEVLAEDGTSLVIVPTIIDSPEAGTGGQGPWIVTLSVDYSGPAALHAFATSPRDGSIVAEDFVEVTLIR